MAGGVSLPTGGSRGLSGVESDEAPLLPRKPFQDDAKFDITAMIDLVFMMNIYFLVTMVGAALQEINMPASRHCVPADPNMCVIITIMEDAEGGPGKVYLGDGPSGAPLGDREAEAAQVREAVEEGVRAGKTTVLVKAERNVQLRDIGRIGTIAAAVPGTELKLGVIEKE